MPVRFALFKAFSIINMLLVLLIIGMVGYAIITRGIAIHADEWLSFTLFIIALSTYLGNSYWSLRLCKKYQLQEDIRRTEKTAILIIFFCLLIFQAILVFYIYQQLQITAYSLRTNLHMRRYDTALLQLVPFVVFLLTLYYQLFLFPFMKAIRKRHNALLENMNHLGKTDIAP